MTTAYSFDLDKLRHIVQKFGAHSFTTAQVAQEYGDGPPTAERIALLDAQLARHAVVLGIQAVPGAQDPVLWQMA